MRGMLVSRPAVETSWVFGLNKHTLAMLSADLFSFGKFFYFTYGMGKGDECSSNLHFRIKMLTKSDFFAMKISAPVSVYIPVPWQARAPGVRISMFTTRCMKISMICKSDETIKLDLKYRQLSCRNSANGATAKSSTFLPFEFVTESLKLTFTEFSQKKILTSF